MSNGRIPKDDATFIAWARQRANQWAGGQSGPPEIGLDSLEIASFEAKTAAAEAAYQAKIKAASDAKDATAAKNVAFAALRAEASSDLARIDAYATTTGGPGVYPLAGVPEPKTPAARTAPDAPTDLRTTVESNGSVTLTFKATTGGGATYLVQRQILPLEGAPLPYEFVGFADDEKRYTDNAVPDGIRAVGYRVAARLSSGPQSAWSVTRTVPFGSQNNGPIGSIEPVKPEEQKGAG